MAQGYNEKQLFNGHITLGFEWRETGHTKYGDSWITNVSWTAYLKADSYGNIESTTSKGWRLVVNGQQADSGTSYVAVIANTRTNIASGTFSYIRGSYYAATSVSVQATYTQEFKIQYAGVGYDSESITTSITLSPILNKAEIQTAANFTDIGNLAFNYINGEGISRLDMCVATQKDANSRISEWVSVSTSSSGFSSPVSNTFRNYLRNTFLYDATIKNCYYVLRTTFTNGNVDYSYALATASLDSPAVDISAEVYDINPATLAITGDKNTLVRFASNAEYNFNVSSYPSGAGISSAYVQNGNRKLDAASGVINGVEDGFFYFFARDTRGVSNYATITKNILEYVKPTCNVEASTELSDTGTEAITKIHVYGNYFNGSFGAVDNTLKIEVKHTQNDGTMGDWVDLSPLMAELDGNTYSLNMTVSGTDYSQKYEYFFRVSDKLMSVDAEPFTLRVLPIFDWSEEDFNFNVPVNMNQNTVLRYNKEVGNTVLSGGSGGKIYLRPSGTDDTDGQVIIHSNGNIEVSGNLDASGFTVNGEPLSVGSDAPTPASYIVATGQESMGTNGIWYWEKWSDGKAVCWGQRNMGAMSLSYTGGFFSSGEFRQSFPSGLFYSIPTIIQISTEWTLDSNSYSPCALWVASYGQVGATEAQTHGFKYFSDVSAIMASLTDFYVVGRWKA